MKERDRTRRLWFREIVKTQFLSSMFGGILAVSLLTGCVSTPSSGLVQADLDYIGGRIRTATWYALERSENEDLALAFAAAEVAIRSASGEPVEPAELVEMLQDAGVIGSEEEDATEAELIVMEITDAYLYFWERWAPEWEGREDVRRVLDVVANGIAGGLERYRS